MKKYSKGLSLITVLMGASLAVIIVFATVKGLQTVNRGIGTSRARTESEKEMNALFRLLVLTGRTARSCSNPTAGTPLRCSIDLSTPPTGNLTSVEFRLDGTGVSYWTKAPTELSYTQKFLFSSLNSLVVCGDAEMNLGTCTILPNNISLQHKANLLAGRPANTFFRFRIGKPQGSGSGQSVYQLQSSFYLRNTEAGASLVAGNRWTTP